MEVHRGTAMKQLQLIVTIIAVISNSAAETIVTSYQPKSYNSQTYIFREHSRVWLPLKDGQAFPNSLSSSESSFNVSLQSPTNCGDTFQRVCKKSRYRSYDGSCNNLQHPTWGMANTRYGRLLPAKYADGINEPARSVTGASLPLARLVSFSLFPPAKIEDPIYTLGAMQWGQIITHDMALVDGATQSVAHATKCCSPTGELLHRSQLDDFCFAIMIPYDDPVYSKAGIRCRNFVRALTDLDRGCSTRHKAAEQLTTVSHFLDLSLVYGSDNNVARGLRTGLGGRMQVDLRNHRQWLPSAQGNKSSACDTTYHHEVCYRAGDTRVNQNPGLTIMQTLLLREHNRVADALSHLNPHWTDETIFQETRRILIAEHQYITYYEWLPLFLGVQGTYGTKILYETHGYVDDYNPHADPSVLNEHSTAAFRYFHSAIAGYLKTVKENRNYSPYDALRLSDHLNRPGVIEEGNNLDDLTRGMAYQPQKANDQYFDEEITVFMFKNKDRLGDDLRAMDIQRNRDHGLASYNAARAACGLPKAKYFTDFLDVIPEANVQKLSQLYASPDDVDLTVGGSLERHVEGTLSGPTFLCIMIKQFLRTRTGDRYWFETSNPQFSFTLEQLASIKQTSIARLYCDNGDFISQMQLRAFEQVSELNPLTDCEHVPGIDLSLWKDYAPQLASHGPFQYKKK